MNHSCDDFPSTQDTRAFVKVKDMPQEFFGLNDRLKRSELGFRWVYGVNPTPGDKMFDGFHCTIDDLHDFDHDRSLLEDVR